MRLRLRRHRCPADVEITFCINGEQIIGPLSGENLAFIARFGGQGDLLESFFPAGRIESLHFWVTYLPPRRR